MADTGFFAFLKRFVRNKSSAPFIFNPYGGDARVSADGKFRRKRPKTVYLQILYDLFIVAALQIFSKETQLVTGDAIASYIAFFTILWAIWGSQALYDLHFRSGHDIFSLAFLFIQLCLFGGLASYSAAFTVAFGFSHSTHDLPQGVYAWVQPRETQVITEDDRQRAIQAASTIYAISRVVLILQYAIVTVQAWRKDVKVRPMLIVMVGLAISCGMWAGAAVCDSHGSPRWATIRICLWVFGLFIEFGLTIWALQWEKHYEDDASFFLERFNALTIIIIGEGVLGLFESFSIVIQGPDGDPNSSVLGVLFAAVCTYLSIYYVYFGHKLETYRGFRGSELAWGILHYPLHLSMLLTFHAINYSVLCVAIQETSDNAFTYGSDLIGRLVSLATPDPDSTTVSDMLRVSLTDENAQYLAIVAKNVGVEWNATLALGAYISNQNTTIFFQYANAQINNVFARLFSAARFKPTTGTYTIMDQLSGLDFDGASSDRASYLFWTAIWRLNILTYKACLFGFATLGGFLCLLAGLQWMQITSTNKRARISIGTKVILGVISMCLMTLNIGGYPEGAFINNQTTTATNDPASLSRMAVLATLTYWYIPSIFAFTLTVIVIDTILYLWKHAKLDQIHIAQHSDSAGTKQSITAEKVVVTGQSSESEHSQRTLRGS